MNESLRAAERQSGSTQGNRDQALAVLRNDLMKLVTKVRVLRDAFEPGSNAWLDHHAAWEDACAALGGVNGLLEPRPATSGHPVLGPPDPDEEPVEFHTYHHHRRARLTGKAAAANDADAMIEVSNNPSHP